MHSPASTGLLFLQHFGVFYPFAFRALPTARVPTVCPAKLILSSRAMVERLEPPLAPASLAPNWDTSRECSDVVSRFLAAGPQLPRLRENRFIAWKGI
ncbi:hypothetical protein MRX96_026864 [Rhipicephalus microplus]